MNEIKIPSITIDTPIPFALNLRDKGQPLEGLRTREMWVRLMRVHIVERYRGYFSEVVGYTVTTVGLSPQTKRQKEFGLSERAEMVKFVNAWFAKTVAAGLKKMAEEQASQDQMERYQNERIAEEIAKAGGVEERRQQIVRDAYHIAAKEAMQYESNEVYGAFITSLIHFTPIVINEETRAKIIERYEENTKTSWDVRKYIEGRTQELDEYLGKTTQTGEAA